MSQLDVYWLRESRHVWVRFKSPSESRVYVRCQGNGPSQPQRLAELPRNTRDAVLTIPARLKPPYAFSFVRQWALEGRGGQCLFECVFESGSPLAPRVCDVSPLTVGWDPGRCEAVSVRRMSFQGGRLTPDERAWTIKGTQRRLPVAEWCSADQPSELLFTPLYGKNRRGPTESLILAARTAQVVTTVEHRLEPRHHVVLRFEAVGCQQLPNGRVEWHYRRKTRMSDSFEIKWSDQGSADVPLPEVSHKDTVEVRFDKTEEPLKYAYRVRFPPRSPGDDELTERRHPEDDKRPNLWTYVFRGLLDRPSGTGKDPAASLETLPHHEEFAQAFSDPGAAVFIPATGRSPLLGRPGCLLQCLLDQWTASNFEQVVKQLCGREGNRLQTWMERPQEFGLLLATPSLLRLVERHGLTSAGDRLSSLGELLRAGRCAGDTDLARQLSQRGDGVIDAWLTTLAERRMPFATLKYYCLERGWTCSALDLMELDGSLSHLRRQPLDGLETELVPRARSKLHGEVDQAIRLTRVALSPDADVEAVRKARRARTALGDSLRTHLKELMEDRPASGPWEQLAGVVEELKRLQLSGAVRQLRGLRDRYLGGGAPGWDKGARQAAAVTRPVPCCLSLDALWLRDHTP